MSHLFRLLRLFTLALVLPSQALALDFTLETNPQPQVTGLYRLYRGEGWTQEMHRGFEPVTTMAGRRTAYARVSGVVEPGDYWKLRDFMNDSAKQGHYIDFLIIDDIPGGNFAAATEIGLGIHSMMRRTASSLLMGVLLPKGSSCLSACAVIGAFAGDQFYVEPGATLGFHLPFLPKEKVDAVNRGPMDVEAIMATTYDISLAYSEMGLHRMASAWLIREAYKHRTADSFFYLRTAEEIHKAGFTPVGQRSLGRPITVESMRLEALGRICNAEFERSRLDKTRDDEMMADFVMRDADRFGSIPSIIKNGKRRWFRIGGIVPQDTDFSCVFGLDKQNRLHVKITKSTTRCLVTYTKLPRMCAVEEPRFVAFVSKYAYDRVPRK